MKFPPAPTAAVVCTQAPPAKTSSDLLLHIARARRGIAAFVLCCLAGLPPPSSAGAVSTNFPLRFGEREAPSAICGEAGQVMAIVAPGRRHPHQTEAIEATDVACDGACFGTSYDLDSYSTR
ncbi:unnamed protein product [Symbiodinium natans]|uniref:Uncharacterized protein n=1 Tax=Symbiodinium natans TaxID=878477 RepID=A0A812J2S8_9DINO|nr:unnamed protein product [Symbiodinium natans]